MKYASGWVGMMAPQVEVGSSEPERKRVWTTPSLLRFDRAAVVVDLATGHRGVKLGEALGRQLRHPHVETKQPLTVPEVRKALVGHGREAQPELRQFFAIFEVSQSRVRDQLDVFEIHLCQGEAAFRQV